MGRGKENTAHVFLLETGFYSRVFLQHPGGNGLVTDEKVHTKKQAGNQAGRKFTRYPL